MSLAWRPLTRHVGAMMFVGVAVFGVATIVFGLSHDFLLSLAALVVLGAADMVSVFIRQTLVQLETPDGMRGRVSAVNIVFIGASNELGEFESGVTAAWWGLCPRSSWAGSRALRSPASGCAGSRRSGASTSSRSPKPGPLDRQRAELYIHTVCP